MDGVVVIATSESPHLSPPQHTDIDIRCRKVVDARRQATHALVEIIEARRAQASALRLPEDDDCSVDSATIKFTSPARADRSVAESPRKGATSRVISTRTPVHRSPGHGRSAVEKTLGSARIVGFVAQPRIPHLKGGITTSPERECR